MIPVWQPHSVRTVACLGAGLIGGGWAALCAAHGLDVVVWDPAEDAPRRLKKLVDAAWPSLTRLGLKPSADPRRIRFVGSAEEAVGLADFVQESGPERLTGKRALLAQVLPALRPDVVLATSTSGFTIAEILLETEQSSQVVVGHPFNPPYLIPLVEVAGASFTDPAAIAFAGAFYESLGRVVVTMAREAPGFIANHLQAALFREALHLVAEGHATPEQIDACLVHGLAPRWSAIGPFMVMHLGNARLGIAGYFSGFHLGSEAILSHLQPPEGTEALQQQLSEGCERLLARRPRDEVQHSRDRAMTSILLAQRNAGVGPEGV